MEAVSAASRILLINFRGCAAQGSEYEELMGTNSNRGEGFVKYVKFQEVNGASTFLPQLSAVIDEASHIVSL